MYTYIYILFQSLVSSYENITTWLLSMIFDITVVLQSEFIHKFKNIILSIKKYMTNSKWIIEIEINVAFKQQVGKQVCYTKGIPIEASLQLNGVSQTSP